MENWLDEALLDKWLFSLRCVGRKHLTAEELWRRWLNETAL